MQALRYGGTHFYVAVRGYEWSVDGIVGVEGPVKTTITADLTRTYLQKLERQNYVATACSVVIVTVSLLFCLFVIGGSNGTNLFCNIMYPVTSAIAAFFAFLTAQRARSGPLRLARHHQLAWLLIGAGLLANSLGGLYYAFLVQTGKLNQLPSLADIGFTLFYPLTFAGLFIMPAAFRLRKRIALDALITTLCIFGIFWYFFVGAVFVKNMAHGGWTNVVAISYPVWDVLLVLAIILLLLRRTEAILRTSLIVFALGVLCQIGADTGFAYAFAIGLNVSAPPYFDPLWFTGFLLFGLAALYQYATIAQRTYNKQVHYAQTASVPAPAPVLRRARMAPRSLAHVQGMLIYLPCSVLLSLLLYSEWIDYTQGAHSSLLTLVLTIIATAVGVLVPIRYVVTTLENDHLLQEREQGRREAERLRVFATELTNILDIESLSERIVSGATSRFGFDAAVLVLLAEFALPLSEHSRLLIVANSSLTPAAISWAYQGAQIGKCDLLVEEECQVSLSGQQVQLPAELEAWRSRHSLLSAFFVPLKYQEQMLGTLCFASCSEQQLSEHDTHFARNYAEQIAPAIEHARLYQTVCEREIFAKALATIATRLNSAVVEPAEIQKLVCAEAAHALRAEHVVLYGLNGSEHLSPLAAFSADLEPQSVPADWPVIALCDFEGQVFHAPRPVLMPIESRPTRQQPAPIHPQSASTKNTAKLTLAGPGREMDYPSPSSLRQKLLRRYVRSAILAPLVAGGDPLGLLVLARAPSAAMHDQVPFVQGDLLLAQDFAEQAAVALTNAQLYERLRSAHQRQQELDQLKDQFMITASHELRTPLTSVQGYIELIAQYDEIMPGEQRQEFLQKAQRSCDELVVLLHNVMDASRLEFEAGIRSTYIERVLVKDMLDSVINLFEPQLTHERREVQLSIPPQLAVYADPSRFRQVLVNLSANALKYSQPQSALLYSARAILDHNRYAIISVTDRGKGITLHDQGRLFERFVRLESDINSPVRGSGLGLYISRRLVEAMGGKIWIESNGIPGEGSTFHVQLPLA
jgi:signal transduction histidine kinase